MWRRTRWAWGLLALVTALAGCNKVADEKTVSIDGDEVKKLQIDPQKSDLKLTVTGQSADVPVNACVVLQEDEDASMLPLSQGKEPPKALASAVAKKDFTLEATLPANKAGTVLLSGGGKKAEVKVKIVGR
jgi:hypothetical protein